MNLKMWGRLAGLFGFVVLLSAVSNWLFVTGSITSAPVIVRVVLAVLGLGVFLATNRGESSPLDRGAFYGTISAVSGAVLVAALAGVNYIAVKKAKSWDFSKDRVNTLSDQTTGVLAGLKEDVKIQAFYVGTEPEYPELEQRLKQYQAQSGKLAVEYVNPTKHPAQVREANISETGPRLIIKSGSKETRTKEVSEEALTNALVEVSRGTTKKVYFSKGHGERAIADKTERGMKLFVDDLKSEGFQTAEILLAENKQAPPDMQTLVIAGPVGQLADSELKLLRGWVEKGGKLVLMLDPGIVTGLEALVASWGAKVGNDEVIDAESENPEVAMGQSYADHPITLPRTAPFAQRTVFPLARSVSKAETPPAGWTPLELAFTGARAWGETSPIKDGAVRFDPGQDLKGPVPLAVALTHGAGESEARVVVIGNSNFVANGYYKIGGNKDFGLNAVSWAAREESRISIRPKTRAANHLFLSAEQKHAMTLFAFDLLPFGLAFAGLAVWQLRKSR